MFDFLFKKPMVTSTGVVDDPRTPEEKAKDFRFDELVSQPEPVRWEEKPKESWRFFGEQDQDGSSSCVAQAARKSLRVLFKVNRGYDIDFSAAHIYRRRTNYPVEGMWMQDAFEVVRKGGVTLNALMPSDGLSEQAMNSVRTEEWQADVAAAFRVPNYVTIVDRSIDVIASIIQRTGKAPVLLYFFGDDEWIPEVPGVMRNAGVSWPSTRRHAVAAVDFTLHNGRKALIVDDSARFGTTRRRIVTEAFHLARCYAAAYPVNFHFEPRGEKPAYEGSTRSLQDCLKWEGMFPSNVESTGVFGPITTKALKEFQAKYDIEQTGTVGPKTRAKLTTYYPSQ